MLWTILVVLAVIALVLFILGRVRGGRGSPSLGHIAVLATAIATISKTSAASETMTMYVL